MTDTLISRGEIWIINLDPVRGHEQAGTRPCLVLSANTFNYGPSQLATILPITTKNKHIASHIPLDSEYCGLTMPSFVKTEDIRSIARERFTKKIGRISTQEMSVIEQCVRILLDL